MSVKGLDLKELQRFNLESGQAYGSGNIKLARDADGLHHFAMENHQFRLTDQFDGGTPFCGMARIIRKSDDKAVWNNYYHGWLTDEAKRLNLATRTVFDFMREALQHPDEATVSRGPAGYARGDFRYGNQCDGDISCFYGEDLIFYRGSTKPVYRCRYGGGLINLGEVAGEASV